MEKAAILGRKVGMTRFFTESGASVPVTVIEIGPCAVTQVMTEEADSYSAVQLAFEDMSPKNSTYQMIGHDAKAGVGPKRFHREFRLEDDGEAANFEVGGTVSAADFEEVFYVDVTATSKGKGMQGGMKRWGFKGQLASHGVKRRHRSPGSIGGHATNLGTGPKIKKGKKMAGHMGAEQVTTRNHEVMRVISDKNLILIKGTVPGPNTGLVFVRSSKRLGRAKQNQLKAKQKG